VEVALGRARESSLSSDAMNEPPDAAPRVECAGVPSMFRLDGRVAIVTGASSGLGERFARVLHGAGAQVVVAARREKRLREFAAQLPRVNAVPCDLASADGVDTLIDSTIDRYGRIDVLVNNAGITDSGSALEQEDSDFTRVLALNLVTPYLLAKRVARLMVEREQPGTIVNVASILGLRGSGQVARAGYAASKGGLINLTRELAAEWARKGIRVNALAPGWFESELTSEMFENDRILAFLRRRTPMGRVGQRDELDGAMLFLASSASSFMTGQILIIDGGWCAV
jgi:NAD(P)-dependent dehydrogenase (short-subunit alcohol dehydrogenase family)